MSENINLKELAEEYSGKSLSDLLKPVKDQFSNNPLMNKKRISHAELRSITDQWVREEISYSRMVELINEHFNGV